MSTLNMKLVRELVLVAELVTPIGWLGHLHSGGEGSWGGGLKNFFAVLHLAMQLQNKHNKQTHLKAVQTANEAAGMMLVSW